MNDLESPCMLLVGSTYRGKHVGTNTPARQILRRIESGFQQPEALMKVKGVGGGQLH